MNVAPSASACFSASCFDLSVSRPSGETVGFSSLTTAFVWETPWLFETKTARISPGLPRKRCAAASGIITPESDAAAPS